ncbi:hypothetical protein [Hymenobacter mucosus]|uniref:Outer membrane protein beta-barrel domain-containing protein n=1 Tax=Hymenobacter mucosus TaxID=1411120 RepID=A0A238YFN4_9BACT|nr:hypothetical protein [Hymenobacter mucosus]SNR69551.1 hypothetical protein SAMN06269173_105181 [Hymenobacter mucosus]
MNHVLFTRSSLFLLVGLCLGSFGAIAQTGPTTGRIESGQDIEPDSTQFEDQLFRKISRFTRQRVEEQRLLKIGLTEFRHARQDGELRDAHYGLNLIYEQKVRPQWSVLAELSPEFVRYREALHGPVTNGVVLASQVAGRYYYNLNKRIRLGKSANNFSANYFSLALGTSYGKRGYGTPLTTNDNLLRGDAVRASIAALYGIQRRLGRYGFVDVYAGLPLPLIPKVGPLAGNNNFRLLLDLRLGLALGQ